MYATWQPCLVPVETWVKRVRLSRRARMSGSRSSNRDKPLHEQPYMDGILRKEQEKLMTKVRQLVISEVSQPPSDMDPTVLAPVLKSSLIKFARTG